MNTHYPHHIRQRFERLWKQRIVESAKVKLASASKLLPLPSSFTPVLKLMPVRLSK
jgi:hypothetical protein